MKKIDLLQANSRKLDHLLAEIVSENGATFSKICDLVSSTLEKNKTVFWCGNGGSAAESSHLAAELIGRFKSNRRPLSSISLNSDIASITCIANDFSYEEIFSRQIEGLAKKGDVLIVLSTSGLSQNICNALIKSKELGVETVAFLGKEGGIAKGLANHSIVVASSETARIQEIHLLLGHTLCEAIEINLGLSD